jgi:hypothetical protein
MGNSLTAKLNKDRLKDTLRRRRAARALTHLVDHSVPTEMRFHGILTNANRLRKPVVHVADGYDLSPYIIHLNAHLPASVEATTDEKSVTAPNLLVPEKFFVSLTDAEAMNPLEDLALTPFDTLGQIREDVILDFTLPIPRPGLGISETRSRKVTDHPEALRSQFAVEPFQPPTPPRDYAMYFELPELDDRDLIVEEEDEAVTIEITDQMAATSPPPSLVRRGEISISNFGFRISNFLPATWLPTGWPRAIAAFVLASFIFVLPIHAMNYVAGLRESKSGIERASQAAVSQLLSGADAVLVRDAAAASASFGKANDAITEAQQSVHDLGAVTSLLISALPQTGDAYRTGQTLLQAGEALSQAGERIAQGVLASQNELSPTPSSRLKLLTAYISSALPNLKEAAKLIAAVNPTDVPEQHRQMFADLNARLPRLVLIVEEFLSFSDLAQTILGASGTMRYLIIFQNNTELRATGGFMGSFAELSVRDGVITKMNVPGGGTYDLQGSLRSFLAAPEPLQLLSARWEFQDANWFPDFPTTARQIMDFYEDAGGGTVDGVIAVNATYVADLIALLGAVDMPEYGRTITADNFLSETQKIVELEYDRYANRPKAFIGDLAPLLLERAMHGSPENFFATLDHVNQGLQTRDLQLYFADGELQREVRQLGWGGELKPTDGDYLMVVDTNLGGGKTDGVIKEEIDLLVTIDEAGAITNTVTITRTHFGEPGALFTGVNNVNYLRLYVPQGSTLLSASGFTIPDASLYDFAPDDFAVDDDLLYSMDTLLLDEASQTAIYNESGKTVFGNWVQTRPGESSTATFTYRLPFAVSAEKPSAFLALAKRALGWPTTDEYTLTVQKQSGVLDRTTRVSVRAPKSLNPIWSSHDLSGAAFTNTTDGFLGVLFEK